MLKRKYIVCKSVFGKNLNSRNSLTVPYRRQFVKRRFRIRELSRPAAETQKYEKSPRFSEILKNL